MSSTYDRVVLNRTKTTIRPSAPLTKGQIMRAKDSDASILAGTISCHAWHPCLDANIVALGFTTTPIVLICSVEDNDSEVEEFYKRPNIKVLNRLEGHHDKPILSIEWAVASAIDDKSRSQHEGNLVTCSEDCRAFVWTCDQGQGHWTASQVFFQHQLIPFAPMDCHWNSSGDKFVIGMGGKRTACLQICSYQPESREWIGWNVGRRQIKSSVLCVAWKPTVKIADNDIVACGGCDHRCRIFHVSEQSSTKRPGEEIIDFATEDKSWVTSVTWSKGGILAFLSKSSVIYIVDKPLSSEVLPVVLKLQPNTCLSCMTFHDKTLWGVGYNGSILLVDYKECQWRVCDKPSVRGSGSFSRIKSFNFGISITGSHGLLRKVQL